LGPRSGNGAAVQEQNLFRREGDYWTIAYGGSLVRLRDSVGLHHLACLLRHSGREILAVALAAADGAADVPPDHGPDGAGACGVRTGLGDAGEVLDLQARAVYKRHVGELREELEEARRFNDVGRAAKAQAELEVLLGELARAVGLQGRARKARSHEERARVNVTRTIKDALRRISRHHAILGRHLAASVRTGRLCAYVPDPGVSIEWRF
jgi:non-specific serine/threonine protein kinase